MSNLIEVPWKGYNYIHRVFLDRVEYRGVLSSAERRMIAYYSRAFETLYTSRTFYMNPEQKMSVGDLTITAEVRFNKGCIESKVFEAGIKTTQGKIRSKFILFMLKGEEHTIEWIKVNGDPVDVERGEFFSERDFAGRRKKYFYLCIVSPEINLSFGCRDLGSKPKVKIYGGANDMRVIMDYAKKQIEWKSGLFRLAVGVDGGKHAAYYGVLVK